MKNYAVVQILFDEDDEIEGVQCLDTYKKKKDANEHLARLEKWQADMYRELENYKSNYNPSLGDYRPPMGGRVPQFADSCFVMELKESCVIQCDIK